MARKSKEQARDLENFEDIMSLGKADVQEPELYPDGTWRLRNVGYSTSDTQDREGNEQLLINLRYVGFEPVEGVDPELVEAGGFEGRTLWVRRYISKPAIRAARDGSLARFIAFVELHGIDTDEMDLDDMCKALKGAEVIGDVSHREYDTKEGEHRNDNTVKNFAAAE